MTQKQDIASQNLYIDILNQIGIALSAEQDKDRLLKLILEGSMRLTNADAGTLYLLKDNALNFEIFANKTLKINPQRLDDKTFPVKPIPLFINDEPNFNNIVTACVLENDIKNIADAYQAATFDFSGTRAADKKLGYRSKSFLAIPLRNHEQKIIGVLQLINAMDPQNEQVTSFSKECIPLAESLASQAAIILTQRELIEAQKQLFEAFIQLIAKAIDAKSHYTSGHCSRVPIITLMLAEAAQKANTGYFADFDLTPNQMEELRIAAWLHDCGKVSTPEYVMDKATKLSALSDRIEVIKLRFELLKRDLKIEMLEQQVTAIPVEREKQYRTAMIRLDESLKFIEQVNRGGEFLTVADKEKILALAADNMYMDSEGKSMSFLSEDDVVNLSVARGTLNDEEREIIKNHVKVTQSMLESLPYPEHLKQVPEIAGSHHERLDGKGYPRGLKDAELSMQARMVAIADVFEALTAADRPYKPAKTLSETLQLMTTMKQEGHIDPNLFDLFVKEKLYLTYANQYLKPEQIDLI